MFFKLQEMIRQEFRNSNLKADEIGNSSRESIQVIQEKVEKVEENKISDTKNVQTPTIPVSEGFNEQKKTEKIEENKVSDNKNSLTPSLSATEVFNQQKKPDIKQPDQSETNESENKSNKLLEQHQAEILKLKATIKSLEESLAISNSRLSEIEKNLAMEKKKYEEEEGEYRKKFRETHTQLQESLREKKELELQIKKLHRDLE
jgi:hypothetical protein